MKKYLILILTLLLAFTLVFSLAACGGNDDGDGDGSGNEGGGNEGGGNEGGGNEGGGNEGGGNEGGGNEDDGEENQAPIAEIAALPFVDKTVTFDGNTHSVAVGGTAPEGVTVDYVGNGQVNAGEHTVTAKFYYNGEYVEGADKTAKIKISKATFDTSGKLKAKSVTFNGEYHSITATDVPSYVTVTYNVEKVRAIGSHTITATFTADPNNVTIETPTRKAVLIISKGTYVTAELTYEQIGDGKYAVTGYTGTKDFIVIPDTYNGGQVVSIKSSAFEGKSDIGYVYMPNTVTNIGNKAFKGCTALTEIRLSNTLSNIGAQAFANVGLKDFKVPASVMTIAQGAFKGTQLESMTLTFVGGSTNSSNEYLGYIFGGSNADAVPNSLKKIVFADECTAIPAYAFNGCTSIKEFVIGKNVVSLGSSAFAGCTSLRSIYIPNTLTTILANAQWSNSPFAGCTEDLMIVMEGDVNLGFGQYWSNITESETALVIYMKTYDDYLENGESFRNVDRTDATLSGIYIDNKAVSGFNAGTLEYNASANVNTGYGSVRAYPSSAAARVVIDAPTLANGGVATVTVTSGDKNTTKVYKVKFNTVTGTLNTNNAVVNKDGADATVSFVIDDGQRTNFHKSMLTKYSTLRLSFAVPTYKLATLTTNADKTEYVMDGGKYTYTQTDDQKAAVAFWQDIMLLGRSEVICHTHTHEFWGTNDDGGEFEYVKNNQETVSKATMPKGSSSKELYASKQIIEEIFGSNPSYLGQNSKNLVLVHAGIGVRTSNFTVGGKVIPTYSTFFNQIYNNAITNGDFLGGRGTFQVTTPEATKSKITKASQMADLNYRKSVPAYMIVTENRNSSGSVNEGGIDNWKAYIDAAVEQNGFAPFCIHNIIPNPTSHDGHNISEADAEELYAYTLSKNIWVATYTDAMIYYSEWSTAKVKTVYVDEKINVTLTDSERNDIFDMALTVKVNVPFNWESAKVGGDTLEVHRADDGSAFVYVNIVPDSGTVAITKG